MAEHYDDTMGMTTVAANTGNQHTDITTVTGYYCKLLPSVRNCQPEENDRCQCDMTTVTANTVKQTL